MATINTLHRLSASSLCKILLAQDAAVEPAAEAATDVAGPTPTIAIIDVRDDDYIGGHIKGARNIPSRLFDAMLPALVHQLQDKQKVVFHCALSQQRGPTAALRYLRERERVLASSTERESKAKEGVEEDGDGEGDAGAPGEQKVYVLDRGFVGWQELYGTDERLTEGYRKDLWKDGYWG
ncbi:Rhodanese-like protein [Trichocladium antarcticum]|uniref:Rhodanese-like protein n=1 Tax=Trichocladium antarcticum TaxID=1450529 RepID=A0AAN6UCX6_9PEZI|nr:Rhodanese-like protein [Trichocladium antarcticum]